MPTKYIKIASKEESIMSKQFQYAFNVLNHIVDIYARMLETLKLPGLSISA